MFQVILCGDCIECKPLATAGEGGLAVHVDSAPSAHDPKPQHPMKLASLAEGWKAGDTVTTLWGPGCLLDHAFVDGWNVAFPGYTEPYFVVWKEVAAGPSSEPPRRGVQGKECSGR